MLEVENGNIIGDWTVICKGEDYMSPKTKSKHPRYVCKCECGKEKLVRQSSLENGDSRGCGCNRDRQTAERMKTHGNSQHDLYQIWYDMNRRCYDPSRKDYKHYGGRGITVWSEWQGETGFEQFVLDMYPTYSDKLELERTDVNGNYVPDNCIWTTRRKQVINRRPSGSNFDTRLIEYEGKTLCISEWSEELGMPYKLLIDRLGKLKWDVVKAFTTPVKYKRLRVSYKNVKVHLDEVFKTTSTCYARAKKMNIDMGKYAAAVFHGTLLDVEAQYRGNWVVIKPEYIQEVKNIKHSFSEGFKEFCEKEGLRYEP